MFSIFFVFHAVPKAFGATTHCFSRGDAMDQTLISQIIFDLISVFICASLRQFFRR